MTTEEILKGLAWKHGKLCKPDRSVGEQCKYFEDFEVDEANSDHVALTAYNALSDSEQWEISETAHECILVEACQ